MTSPNLSSVSCSSRMSAFASSNQEAPLARVMAPSESAAASNASKFIPQIGSFQKSLDSISDDPEFFFNKIQIDHSLFDKKDVQCIKGTFNTIKLSQDIYLFDLIGLKIYSLIEKLCKRWPDEGKERAKKNWSCLYLQFFLTLLKEISQKSAYSPDESSRHFFYTFGTLEFNLEEFIKALKDDATIFNRIQGKKDSTIYSHLKNKTDSLFAELTAVVTVLKKCLSLEKPAEILCTYDLTQYPGSEDVIPTSPDEALKNLYLYLHLISTALEVNLDKKLTNLKGNYFSPILKKISPLLKFSKGAKEIPLRARECIGSIHLYILNAHEKKNEIEKTIHLVKEGSLDHDTWCRLNGMQKTTSKNQNEFLDYLDVQKFQVDCMYGWLMVCASILEQSIIAPMDSSSWIPNSYQLRMMSNLKKILQDADSMTEELSGYAPEVPLSTVGRKLERIKERSMAFLSRYEGFLMLYALDEKLQNTDDISLLKPSFVKELVSQLKAATRIALDEFPYFNKEDCKKEPLSERLSWLSRLFVLCHDVETISQKDSEILEEEIFPESFLDFLSLEEDSITNTDFTSSSSSSEISFQQSESSPSRQIDILRLDTEKTEKKSSEASPIKLESVALESVYQAKLALEAPAENLLKNRKRQIVIKILKALDLELPKGKGK